MPRIDRRLSRQALLVALAGILSAGGAAAQTEKFTGLKLSGDQPIQIESDKLEVHENDSLAIFSGNVSVVQGTTLLKAGKMTVYYVKDGGSGGGAGSGSAATASANKGGGSVATGSTNIDHLEVDDKVFVKSDTQTATGDKGTFDMKTETLTLSGTEVVLSDGPNVLTGCLLTVNMKTGLAELGACKGGRVKTLLTPSSQKPSGTQSQ